MMYLIGHPPSLTAPAVQDRHLEGCHIGSCPLHIFMDLPKLCHDILDFINETGPITSQLQITAISNPVQGRSE